MRSALCLLVAAALAAPATSHAITVTLRDPGYLQIDGIYYAYDRPRNGTESVPAELHPRSSDGFYLRSLLSMSQCSGDVPEGGASPATLRHAELLDHPSPPQLGLRVDGPGARFHVAACDGAVVLITRSASGSSRCAGAVPFPFRRGQCAAIDANDPGLIFFSAFETR
jgi:hypothetical protein